MKGLILKDIYSLKKSFILIFICFSILFGVAVVSDFSGYLLMFPIFGSTIISSSFSIDEMSKWNLYVFSLPSGRKAVISSKYILLTLVCLASAVVTFVIELIVSGISENAVFNLTGQDIFLFSAASFAISLTNSAITIPFILAFSSNVARFFPALFIGIICGFAPLITDKPDFLQNLELLPYILIGIVIAIFIASWIISIRIYEKKEF